MAHLVVDRSAPRNPTTPRDSYPALGELMGEIALRYPHIDIWGGCCGTWDNHLDEIARRVRAARSMTT